MTEQPKYHCRTCKRKKIVEMLAVVDFHHKRKDRLLIAGAVLVVIGMAVLIGLGVWAVGQVYG